MPRAHGQLGRSYEAPESEIVLDSCSNSGAQLVLPPPDPGIQQGSDPNFRLVPCRTAVDYSALQCACARAEEALSDLVSPTNPILYISYERKEGFIVARQIMFKDTDGSLHGGIRLDNGDVICACCGCIFEADDEGTVWELVREFNEWINLDEESCGDELNDQTEPADESDVEGFDEVYT